jgi:hypothetical protein
VRDLATRIPWEVRLELLAAAQVLATHGPAVAEALETLQRATNAAWFASMVPASLDPAEVADATDAEWDRLEDVTGIARGWAEAFRIATAITGTLVP